MWTAERWVGYVNELSKQIMVCQARARKDAAREALVGVLEKWLTMAGNDLPDVFATVNIRALAEATASLILDGGV